MPPRRLPSSPSLRPSSASPLPASLPSPSPLHASSPYPLRDRSPTCANHMNRRLAAHYPCRKPSWSSCQFRKNRLCSVHVLVLWLVWISFHVGEDTRVRRNRQPPSQIRVIREGNVFICGEASVLPPPIPSRSGSNPIKDASSRCLVKGSTGVSARECIGDNGPLLEEAAIRRALGNRDSPPDQPEGSPKAFSDLPTRDTLEKLKDLAFEPLYDVNSFKKLGALFTLRKDETVVDLKRRLLYDESLGLFRKLFDANDPPSISPKRAQVIAICKRKVKRKQFYKQDFTCPLMFGTDLRPEAVIDKLMSLQERQSIAHVEALPSSSPNELPLEIVARLWTALPYSRTRIPSLGRGSDLSETTEADNAQENIEEKPFVSLMPAKCEGGQESDNHPNGVWLSCRPFHSYDPHLICILDLPLDPLNGDNRTLRDDLVAVVRGGTLDSTDAVNPSLLPADRIVVVGTLEKVSAGQLRQHRQIEGHRTAMAAEGRSFIATTSDTSNSRADRTYQTGFFGRGMEVSDVILRLVEELQNGRRLVQILVKGSGVCRSSATACASGLEAKDVVARLGLRLRIAMYAEGCGSWLGEGEAKLVFSEAFRENVDNFNTLSGGSSKVAGVPEAAPKKYPIWLLLVCVFVPLCAVATFLGICWKFHSCYALFGRCARLIHRAVCPCWSQPLKRSGDAPPAKGGCAGAQDSWTDGEDQKRQFEKLEGDGTL